MICGKDRF